jgi:hypothetical protein
MFLDKVYLGLESLNNCNIEPVRCGVRKSACQFVYRGSLGDIYKTLNKRSSNFSPPGRQPAIQKVPKLWNEGSAYSL